MTEFIGGVKESTGIRKIQRVFNLQGLEVRVFKSLAFAAQKDQALEGRIRKASVEGLSQLGTLVADEVIMQAGRYFDLTDIDTKNPISYEGMKLHTVLLTVDRDKNIIRTSIQGRDGEVIEYISNGNYNISMFGMLVGENQGDLTDDVPGASVVDIGNFYPESDTQLLINICNVPDTITITSKFLNQFGIGPVAVTGFSFPQREGFINTQPFQINMISDTPIPLNELEVPISENFDVDEFADIS